MRYDRETLRARRYRMPEENRRGNFSFSRLILYVLLLGLFTGFGSVWWSLSGAFPLGRERAGAWIYWPDIGSPGTDPYAHAMINRDALLPLGGSEGIELLATRDTSGRPLNVACSYRLGSTVPEARFWSLGAYGTAGGFLPTDSSRVGFTSSDIVRHEDGTFAITLSRQASPGNWLPLAGNGRFVLVLRLYDVPATPGRTLLDPRLVPTIERLECAS